MCTSLGALPQLSGGVAWFGCSSGPDRYRVTREAGSGDSSARTASEVPRSAAHTQHLTHRRPLPPYTGLPAPALELLLMLRASHRHRLAQDSRSTNTAELVARHS